MAFFIDSAEIYDERLTLRQGETNYSFDENSIFIVVDQR